MESEEIIRKILVRLYREHGGMPPDVPIYKLKKIALEKYKLLPEQWAKLLKEVIRSEHLWAKNQVITATDNEKTSVTVPKTDESLTVNINSDNPSTDSKAVPVSIPNQEQPAQNNQRYIPSDAAVPVSIPNQEQPAQNNQRYIPSDAAVPVSIPNQEQPAQNNQRYIPSDAAVPVSIPNQEQPAQNNQRYIPSDAAVINEKNNSTIYVAIISVIGLLLVMVYIGLLYIQNNDLADTNKKIALLKQKLQPECHYICWRKDNKVFYHFYIKQNEDKLRYRYRICNNKIDSIGYFTIDTLNLSINVDRWEEDMKLNIQKKRCYLMNEDWSIDLGTF